jgi:hypothetical protein
MKRSTLTSFLLCAFAALCLAAPAFAQGTASRVTGTVLDQAGSVVPGATVTLTNEATNVSFNTETTDTGTYAFDSVQVGIYTVTVEKAGFKKFVSTSNVVNVNQPATVDVALQTGDIAEVVTVESSAELVQTSSSGNFGNTVEERPLQSLPIVGNRGRNPLSFILFQPGVTPDANTGGGVHVHGSRDRAFNFTLDGIDINETSAGGSNFTPLRTNPDSITQFQVVTGNFTAELGRSSGAQVTLVTKSGTNEFHGNLFEFYQTPRFHANEYQNTINTRVVNGSSTSSAARSAAPSTSRASARAATASTTARTRPSSSSTSSSCGPARASSSTARSTRPTRVPGASATASAAPTPTPSPRPPSWTRTATRFCPRAAAL